MSVSREMTVGLFVLVGLLCIGWMTVKLGRMELLGNDGYTLTARFTSVAGLRTGADVEIAGVRVGRVASIGLEQGQALVTLSMNKGVQLSRDTIASVKTSGLIGDKYVNLAPGGDTEMLQPNDTIEETESAMDIESLISKYALGGV